MIHDRFKLLFAICFIAVGSAGCAFDNLKPKQSYEVLGEAQNLTPEEEAAIRNKGNGFTPADAINAEPLPVQLSIDIRKNESLYSVISRIKRSGSYSRVIYDLSKQSQTPDRIKANRALQTRPRKNLLEQVENLYQSTYPYLKVFTASDNGQQALVVSDKPYPTWSALAVYDVPKGTLKDAVSSLANTIGWKLEETNGYQAQNFNIDNEFPIIISPSDPKISFTALLFQYPARAQLNPNNRSATIVTRIQPKIN